MVRKQNKDNFPSRYQIDLNDRVQVEIPGVQQCVVCDDIDLLVGGGQAGQSGDHSTSTGQATARGEA